MVKDYKNTKIYKIVNDENDNFYLGHTIERLLCQRMSKHRDKHSLCMSKNLGVDIKECKIILVEKYPCKDVEEAKKRERFYIEKYQNEGLDIVNKYMPGRTMKEWRQLPKNKLKIKKWKKIDYTKHKEAILEKKKIYYQKNKDEKKLKSKLNYETKKEVLKQKITCECGSTFNKSSLNCHKKTRTHQAYMFLKDIEQSIFITN